MLYSHVGVSLQITAANEQLVRPQTRILFSNGSKYLAPNITLTCMHGDDHSRK